MIFFPTSTLNYDPERISTYPLHLFYGEVQKSCQLGINWVTGHYMDFRKRRVALLQAKRQMRASRENNTLDLTKRLKTSGLIKAS